MFSAAPSRATMTEAVETKRPRLEDAPAASFNPFASLVATPVAAKRAPADESSSPSTAIKLSRDELAWRPTLTLPPPTPRESAAMVVFNGQAVAFGGTTKSPSGFPVVSDELITLDLGAAAPSWRQLQCSGVAPCPRAGHAMCVSGASIVMYIHLHGAHQPPLIAAAGMVASILTSDTSLTCGCLPSTRTAAPRGSSSLSLATAPHQLLVTSMCWHVWVAGLSCLEVLVWLRRRRRRRGR